MALATVAPRLVDVEEGRHPLCLVAFSWGPLSALVGAAPIENYSSYVQVEYKTKKSSTCFFPKTGARGPETTPRQVADASPLLANFVE